VNKKSGLPKKLSLRTVCKKNELPIIDLGTVDLSVDMVGAAVDELDAAVGTQCSARPDLVLATSQTLDDPCIQYEGNETACLNHFVAVDGSPVSCAYFRGICFACTKRWESTTDFDGTLCDNACSEADRPACTGDASRTAFAGWPEYNTCSDIRNESLCNIAYYVESFVGQEYASSCRWVDNVGCLGCNAFQVNQFLCEDSNGFTYGACESDGDCGEGQICERQCRNTCGVTPPIQCADGSRKVVSSCDALNGTTEVNRRECDQRYVIVSSGEFPGAASCYWREGAFGDSCEACDFLNGIQNHCGGQSNKCIAQ
jgi:hypothetical protein